MFEWSYGYFFISLGIITLGSLIQAATGMGAGFIVVPLLALISMDLVPGPTVSASLLLTVTMTIKGRKDIHMDHLAMLIAGLVIGITSAGFVVSRIDIEGLQLLFGILLLIAIGISVLAPAFKFAAGHLMTSGLVAGFIGTIAGVGGPILALVFQHHKAPVIRATLAFLYAISSVMMLISLHFAGRFGIEQIVSGLYLMPGFVVGYLVAPRFSSYVDKGMARPFVLAISCLCAVMLIYQAVFGG